jgi:hypothetical protein
MKIYVHENSPYDEIFRGVRSYEEVQDRFQSLSPNEQDGFVSFQKHGRNSLPKVLQGEKVATPPSQKARTTGSESSHSGQHKVEKTPKSSEVLTHKLEATLSDQLSPRKKAQLEAFLKQGQTVPPLSPTTLPGTSNTTDKQQSTKIGTPITSLTPLQYSLRNPNSKIFFVNDLTPISLEEMPPSDFFFSRNWKAIVKRESHQKYGVITKKQRMVYDGNNQDAPKFAKEVAGSLGAFDRPINGLWKIWSNSCDVSAYW